MPTLDWLDREHAFRIARRVPTMNSSPKPSSCRRPSASCW
jgi:hypothetical protein